MKKLIIAASMLGASFSAQAWTWFPGLPDPVTWALHAAFGFYAAKLADEKLGATPATGVGIATAIGVGKEVSDINFSHPDWIAMTLGGALYYYTRDIVLCPERENVMQYDDWHSVFYEHKIEDCAK